MNIKAPQFIVSTDLDGTLLDHHTYDWQPAKPAIEQLSNKNIPIVFNTSKTFAEARKLQAALDIEGPLVIENGSALALPMHFYDEFKTFISDNDTVIIENYVCIRFGCTRTKILDFIREQRSHHNEPLLDGYNDWSIEKIQSVTGLSYEDAKDSSEKGYSEPFIWHATESKFQTFQKEALESGLQILKGGRFYHLQGDTNKGVPLMWLRELFSLASGITPELICLGDNHNDVHMLNVADIPVCIKSPVADYPEIRENPKAIYTEKYGPHGWNDAIHQILI